MSRPESGANPADAGCKSDNAQYSSTPSLRSPGFEDSLSDEAQALYCRPLKSASQARGAPQPGRGRSRNDDDEDENEAPREWRPTGLFWAWCVDPVRRANIAILDCTNRLAQGQHLGRSPGASRSAFVFVFVLEGCCLQKRRVNPIRSASPELHPRSGLKVLVRQSLDCFLRIAPRRAGLGVLSGRVWLRVTQG
jgi:hypothetical protein